MPGDSPYFLVPEPDGSWAVRSHGAVRFRSKRKEKAQEIYYLVTRAFEQGQENIREAMRDLLNVPKADGEDWI